jgi:hypothetical protein
LSSESPSPWVVPRRRRIQAILLNIVFRIEGKIAIRIAAEIEATNAEMIGALRNFEAWLPDDEPAASTLIEAS